MRLNLALYRIDVTDEIVVNTNAGGRSTFKNASKTKREGLELAWDGKFSHGLEAALAYTLLDARFEQPFTTVISTPSIPVTVSARQPAARRAAPGFLRRSRVALRADGLPRRDRSPAQRQDLCERSQHRGEPAVLIGQRAPIRR
jgi:hypothetical protein